MPATIRPGDSIDAWGFFFVQLLYFLYYKNTFNILGGIVALAI